jgi:Rieske Fe-S protein
MRCREQTRRSLLLTALVAGTRLAPGMSVAAQEDQPASDERPQKGDLLVLSEGDGIVAYSVICTWVKAEGGDKNVLKCPCYNSEFNPRESAQVVFGPVPRRLAALPLTVADGSLIVAATFVGKVGAPQPG